MSPSWHSEIADNRYWAKLAANPTNLTLAGQNGQCINGSALKSTGR